MIAPGATTPPNPGHAPLAPEAPRGATTSHPGVAEALRDYDVVVGIEIHCQLATASKIFCPSANAFGEAPNSNIDPVCLALPGALPVLNEACVDLAIRMGLATECEIRTVSVFERKNYFYPDLPKGYQITQFRHPVCAGGAVTLSTGTRVRIDRIQLEEDAGKNVHAGGATLLDFNRAGVGLIEIVSAPDMATPEEASEYVRRVHAIAVALGVSDGDLEKGNFRADANVSLKPKGSGRLGQRTEIKNVNSFRYLEKAVAHEVERQHAILASGGRVSMETRGFDAATGTTFTQRSKEQAHDYRYFPDPDLPPLVVSAERVERIRAALPELPEARVSRYVDTLGVGPSEARALVSEAPLHGFFEAVLVLCGHAVARGGAKVEARAIANLTLAEAVRTPAVPPALAADVLLLVAAGTISARMVREILDEALATGKAPADLVKEKGLEQVSDDTVLLALVREVVDANPAMVAEYLGGKEKLLAFFVGQAMKKGQGKPNPGRLNELVKAELAARRTGAPG